MINYNKYNVKILLFLIIIFLLCYFLQDQLKKTFIHNIFLGNQKIHDELKSKNQFIKNKAVLYENIYKGNQKNYKNLDELDFNIITYSENSTD